MGKARRNKLLHDTLNHLQDPKRNEPPTEYLIYVECRNLDLPAVAGGALDQPARLSRDFGAIREALQAYEDLQPGPAPTTGIDMTKASAESLQGQR